MIFVNMIAGVITAILAGLGVGGGGLLVIYLALILDVPQLQAQGINLVFYLFASAASLAIHYKKRNINWKLALICALSGIIGAFIGVKLIDFVEPLYIRKIFGVFLLASGGFGFIQTLRNFKKNGN